MSEPEPAQLATLLVDAWFRRKELSSWSGGVEMEAESEPAPTAGSIAAVSPSAAAATLGLWVFLLVFGGGCLALYYARIRYIPEIRWEESLTELGVLSILGGCVVVLFGLLALLPGVIWSEALVWDVTLQRNLTYLDQGSREPGSREPGSREPCPAGIWRRIGLPFTVFMICVHFGLFRGGAALLAVSSVMGILLALLLCLRQLRADLGYGPADVRRWSWPWLLTAHRDHRSGKAPESCLAQAPDPHGDEELHAAPHSRLTKYLFWFSLSALLGWASLVFELVLLGWRRTPDWWLGGICTLVVVAANFAVAMLFKLHRSGAILTGVVAAFVLLAAGEVLEGRASLVNRVMGIFGVGEDAKVVLVAKKEAREILEGQHIPYDNVSTPQGAVRVSNVSMLSRLGIDYFLRYGGRQFLLPKDKVWSWSAEAGPRIIVLRDHEGDSDLSMESGRLLGREALFAGAGAGVATKESRPEFVVTMMEEPSRAWCLVRLRSDHQQRILSLKATPIPGAEFEPEARVGGFSPWQERPDVWHLPPREPLRPGEYGLWDSRSGELAAFAVKAPK
jgi:hypothetical protein